MHIRFECDRNKNQPPAVSLTFSLSSVARESTASAAPSAPEGTTSQCVRAPALRGNHGLREAPPFALIRRGGAQSLRTNRQWRGTTTDSSRYAALHGHRRHTQRHHTTPRPASHTSTHHNTHPSSAVRTRGRHNVRYMSWAFKRNTYISEQSRCPKVLRLRTRTNYKTENPPETRNPPFFRIPRWRSKKGTSFNNQLTCHSLYPPFRSPGHSSPGNPSPESCRRRTRSCAPHATIALHGQPYAHRD